jgi:hypothetical protein
MFKPNARSGDEGLAEIERRRRETESFERSREHGREVCPDRPNLNLNLRSNP